MRVYSFLPPSGDIRDFSCDVKDFYNYLEKTHAFPAKEQNVIGEFDGLEGGVGSVANVGVAVYQVGTEAFMGGPATFTVSKFTADLS
jgi:xyloglucan-specific endo-beta-1,4-glucanase